MTMRLTSSAFHHLGAIPARYTCDGEDCSPPLAWEGVPAEARSLAFIVTDPDAPDPRAPRMTWVHWIIYNMPVSTRDLAEGAADAQLPPGTRQGQNDWKQTGYRGPCPPIGRHRYFHSLYALDTELPDLGTANRAALDRAMTGHVLAVAELVGTYGRT